MHHFFPFYYAPPMLKEAYMGFLCRHWPGPDLLSFSKMVVLHTVPSVQTLGSNTSLCLSALEFGQGGQPSCTGTCEHLHLASEDLLYIPIHLEVQLMGMCERSLLVVAPIMENLISSGPSVKLLCSWLLSKRQWRQS